MKVKAIEKLQKSGTYEGTYSLDKVARNHREEAASGDERQTGSERR